jgi:WD40 repeat protein/tRNA A-37 threonylcarbamoyl transferase component Bud32
LVVGADRLAGRRLGEFVIQERIGEGGFGAVYRASQPALERQAVVKVMHTRLRAASAAAERFLREAKLASKLDHPYAAHVYAFGAEADGELWIAMELVRGTPLDEVLKIQGPVPLERLVPLVERICEVVQTAHEQGIVHRDLKPANVMVLARAGRLLPKLLDLGIAKALSTADPSLQDTLRDAPVSATEEPSDSSPALTQRGVVMGSPPYMAPEQWGDAASADARTDLYALGVLTYEVLTGKPPFTGTTVTAYALAHACQDVPPLGSRFPAALDTVFAKALAKDPTDRYPSAIAFAEALRRASGITAEGPPLPGIEEVVRQATLTDAPQPIAEAVAVVDAARNPHQARDAHWQLLHTIVRYLGLVALACRSRVSGADDTVGTAALRHLYRRPLGDREWVDLTSQLTRAWLARPDAYPIPELVELFHDGGDAAPTLDRLIALREMSTDGASDDAVVSLLARAAAEMSSLLASLRFLADYALVVPQAPGIAERWMGTRRAQRSTTPIRGKGLAAGVPALIDHEGVPVLSLAPLLQVATPTPGAPLELFLFDGRSKRGARLVALPTSFEYHDDELWDWFRAQLTDSLDDPGTPAVEERPPYRGLSTFTTDDSTMFFGREKQVDAFVNRLRIQPLLVLVGRSGAGKSSFVQAGVIPALSDDWKNVTVRPGPSPLAALAARCQASDVVIGELRGAPREALGDALRDHAAAHGWILLVVDQLEEAFTLCSDEAERNAFLDSLASAARTADDSVRIVFTLRDDFLVRAEQAPALRNRLAQSLQLLTVPGVDDLMRILIEPARRAGYEFEDPALPEEMVREVADQPGALALLSFTAAQLWELRDRHFKQLTRKAYRSLGGVGGALARHAEQTLDLMTAEERRLARDAFRQLVTIQNTRAVLARKELYQLLGATEHADAMIEKLVAARLLVTADDESGVDRIEIVHEALLSAWPRLVEWRREDAEGARFHQQLRAAARQWDDRGRPRGQLWRDDALGELARWRTRHAKPLTEIETAFADASARDAARGRRTRRVVIVAMMSVLAIAVVVLAQLRSRAKDLQRDAELKVIAQNEEQGRQALVAGDSLRAAVYLSAAYSAGVDTPALRFMLARALTPPSAELLRFEGHTGPIQSVEVSPDGRTLLTVSDDRTARLWDLDTGHARHTFDANAGLWRGRFDPSGKRIVTAANDGVARVYSIAGQLLASTSKHDGLVIDARFDATGQRVVTAAYDGTAGVWDAATGARLASLDTDGKVTEYAAWITSDVLVTCNHSGTIRIWSADGSVRLGEMKAENGTFVCDASPDGSIIASGGEGRTVVLWDVEHRAPMRELAGHSHTVEDLAFDPAGKLIATADQEGVVLVWRVADGKLLTALVGHSAAITAVRFDATGTTLVTASRDGTVRYWNVGTGLQLGKLEGHVDPITTVAFEPKTSHIITGAHDGTARRWTMERSAVKALVIDDQPLGGVRCSPDGAEIVTFGESVDDDVMVRIWDARNGRRIASLRPGIAELDASGNRVVVGSADGAVTVWDAKIGALLATLPKHSAAVAAVTFSPDGRLVASAGSDGGQIADVNSSPALQLNHRDLTAIVFSRSGSRLLTTSRDGSARIWDIEGHAIAVLAGHQDEVIGGAFNPDGKTLVTASHDATARVWDAVTGRERAVLRDHAGAITSVHFDTTGQTIVTTSQDLTAKLWNASDGRLLGTLSRHDLVPLNAAFSPDGRFVATASGDRTLAIWDVATSRMVDRLRAHNSFVYDVTWARDGLLSASGDQTIAAWEFVLETRAPADISEWVRCHVPYVLQNGTLVHARTTCTRDHGSSN